MINLGVYFTTDFDCIQSLTACIKASLAPASSDSFHFRVFSHDMRANDIPRSLGFRAGDFHHFASALDLLLN